SVYLPRMPSGLPPIRRHPFSDRFVRFVHAIVRAAVDGDSSLSLLRFGCVHLARSFKCARDLDTEIARYRCARLFRVVVEKNVVPMSSQAWLAAKELPDLVQGRPPRRPNRARLNLAPHGGQLPGVNALQVDGDGHPLIVNQDRDRVPVTSGVDAQAACMACLL